ncbi:MAG: glycosyltransferase family 4 protein [Chloroflexi bacterium]|nr:glycosyltransferase family 4 protein [Chloroflexota bacterium]
MQTLQIAGDSVYGGDTYLLLRWCRYLVERGCGVEVVTTDATTISALRDIAGVHINDSIYIPREIAPGADIRAFFQLQALMRNREYQVVHTYTATPGFLGRMAARFVAVPVIVHHQISWNGGKFASLPEKLLYRPIESLATLASTRSICVSHATVDQARRYRLVPLRKLVTICNGIDPTEFLAADSSTLRNELGISEDTLVIGNTGRLMPQKDNQTLIRAMEHIGSLVTGRPIILLLAGDGPDRPMLEDIVHSLGLGEQVRLLGFRRDIPAFLAGLDIFVNPSLWEGLSISLMEAMAAAKPIVTTSIPPNAELIQQGVTGLLVPPNSPKQVAEAIAQFVREPGLAQRCAGAARQRVLEHYTIDRMFQETWDLYVNLLAKKRPESAVASVP